MNVVKADHAGACFGVQRALDIALEASKSSARAHTLGPLIHNPIVVRELAEAGVDEIASVSEADPNDTVIIRSHGVTPQVMRDVESHVKNVLDATCPFVAAAQKAAYQLAEKHGCVVVVGEEGHPEVEGLTARAAEAPARVIVASSPDDLPDDVYDPVGIVVQTTQERAALDAVVDELRKRGINPDVKNTICTATSQRQDAAIEIASQVDAVVVIGGRNSSNTTRLASICRSACARTYHIESPDELDPSWFKGCETVGVTAGASTPESQISRVIEYLEAL